MNILNIHYKKIQKRIFKVFKWALLSLGMFFLIMLILSFTTLPFWGVYDLAVSESDFDFQPDYIVLMGGAGIPSNTALMRSYYTAELSKKYSEAKIIIALPSNLEDSTAHIYKMEQELRIRQVKNTVLFEPKGQNTRGQALNILEKIDCINKLVLVSSPEHMYRAVNSFKKVGFLNVGGYSAFEQNIENTFSYNSEELGGKKYVPEIGDGTQLRYQFWNHLKFEIILLREYTAIIYYKIQGWI